MKTRLLLIILLSLNFPLPAFQSALDTLGNFYSDSAKLFFENAHHDSAIFYFEKANKHFFGSNEWENYVDAQNHIIFSLREIGRDDSALVIAKHTLEFAELKLGKHNKHYARTLNETARIYNKKGKFDEAFKYVNESMELLKSNPLTIEISENYSLMGLIYRQIGEYDSAFTFLNKSLQLKKELLGEDHSSVGSVYNNIAYVFEEKGDYLKAGEYYNKSLTILTAAAGEDYRELPKIYNNIAANYFYRGENDLALEYYRKAVYLEEVFLEPDHLNFGLRYNNIAMALRVNKEYDDAVIYAQRAIEIFKKRLGEEHPNYAAVINNLGRIYSDMEEYEEALKSYQTSYSILQKRFGEKHPTVSQTLNNIAEVFYKTGDIDNALANSNEALRIRTELLGLKHPRTAESYKLTGDIYLKNNNPDSALYFYQHAVIALADDFDNADVYANPDIDNVLSGRNLLSVLSRKANAFSLKYKAGLDERDLREAFSNYLLCSQLVSKIRRGYKTEGAKLSIETHGFRIYEEGINAAKLLYESTGDFAYLETAFELAERNKAGVLLEALTEANAKKFSGIPDSLAEYERQLKVDLSYFDTQIQKEKEKGSKIDSLKLKKFESDLFALNRKYEELMNLFERNYTDYFNLKYDNSIVSVREIQNDLLNDNEALIEYVVGDNSLFIFLMVKEKFVLKNIPLKHPLDDLVKKFRIALSNLDFDEYISAAYELYTVLFLPVEQEMAGCKKIHIIPDGILNYLPFESLLTDRNSYNQNFSRLNYLINKYEVSYYFSASTLSRNTVQENFIKGFAGFAPVFSDDATTQIKIASVIDTAGYSVIQRAVNAEGKIYSSLPETEKEVTGIFRLFNSKNIPAKTYLHNDAKESIIKSNEVNNYNMIHIASHGFINESKPKLSGILFWIDESDEDEDGVLYSNEIYTLNLDAVLVVLSACETGLGKIIKGEGIIGLTRGFTYAGAKNIIVSLWQVADESTSELMVEFYKNVLDGKNYSSALRDAKLKLIKDGTYAYPLEWSSFVLIGK